MDAMQIMIELGTPAGQADPYPLYAALHELGEIIDLGDGQLIVVGYDAINLVLRDPGFRVSDEASFDEGLPDWKEHPVFVQGADWILNLNGERHHRIRQLIARAFTARRVAGLEPAIGEITDDLLDAMADRAAGGSAVEFMHDFAYLLPITVICELIGIPEADRESFRPIARDIARVFELTDPSYLDATNRAATELLSYFTALAARRRAEPRDDLLSDLLAIADSDDGRLTDAELLHNLTLLLVAGFETTTNLLGNGLAIMLDDPAAGDAVRNGSVPAAAFVEEVLRYDSPVQLTSRFGYQTTLNGTPVAASQPIVTVLGAGNRDPRRFERPDAFNPLRRDGGPPCDKHRKRAQRACVRCAEARPLSALSFGGGAHFCIGAALARLEGTVAFPRLAARFATITAAGAPVRREGLLLRGFDALPVTLS